MPRSRCSGGALIHALQLTRVMRRGRARPPGTYHDVTDAIVEGVKALRAAGKTQASIAEELGDHMGQRVDPSSISNIEHRVHETSRIAYPLAKLYGWPLPPVSRTDDPELSQAQAKLAELKLIAPGRAGEFIELLDNELETARRRRRLLDK